VGEAAQFNTIVSGILLSKTPDTIFNNMHKHKKEVSVLPDKQKTAYRAFYDSARNNGILDPKTTVLIHLTSAMAFGCYP